MRSRGFDRQVVLQPRWWRDYEADARAFSGAIDSEPPALSLRGAWRATPPPLELSLAQLEHSVERFIDTGVAGLAWHAIAPTALRDSPPAERLRNCVRLQAIENRLIEARVGEVLAGLAQLGLAPVVMGGVVLAQRYPVGTRAAKTRVEFYFANSAARATASRWLMTQTHGLDISVCDSLAELDAAAALANAVPITFGAFIGKSFAPIELLRIVCARAQPSDALSLIDVAAVAESVPHDFDWDAFGAVPALMLAQQMLDARVGRAP